MHHRLPLVLMAVCGCEGSPKPPPPPEAPSVVERSPADGAVVATIAVVHVTFSRAMAPLAGSALLLEDPAGAAVAATVASSGAEATLTPDEPLAFATAYTARITDAARDEEGAAMAAESWTFTTEDAPESYLRPEDGATDVSPTTQIAVWTASVPDAATLCTLQDSSGAPVAGTWLDWHLGTEWNELASRYFAPDQRLEPSTSYTLEVDHLFTRLGSPVRLRSTFTTIALGTGSWTPTSITGAPSARASQSVVWTGSEMIVWGGSTEAGYTATGGRYDPAQDTWRPTSILGAPGARARSLAVWTGTRMLIWGGEDQLGSLADGGAYDPVSDTWSPLTAPGPARTVRSVVWTGTEMIVWGGLNAPSDGPSTVIGDGARYDVTTGNWTPVSMVGAPSARGGHSAVWTGSEMIIWGGYDYVSVLADGAMYSPATDTWTPMPTLGAPSPRFRHRAVWTGTEMIVWGGLEYADELRTGGRFEPGVGWVSETTQTGAPPATWFDPTAVWTGAEMIVWGGATDTGGRYAPETDSWTLTFSGAGTPKGRANHTAVWTGSAMILWGGSSVSDAYPALDTGGVYTP